MFCETELEQLGKKARSGSEVGLGIKAGLGNETGLGDLGLIGFSSSAAKSG